MFTGIIENFGIIQEVTANKNNISYIIESEIAAHLKVDESVSHNGVCLTVEEINGSRYRVTAVDETLKKTNAKHWEKDTMLNLERAMLLNGRLDGHIVQGHVDDVAKCIDKKDAHGSTEFTFEFQKTFAPLIIEKGSVCLNGVSLTAFNVTEHTFNVTIIPYTMEHTNFKVMKVGDLVNIEFDVLGKYVQRSLQLSS